ncbi:MAG: cell division protein SepF [Propionibacteriaceae bacterium]|jgi:cell division inhibitor SepF|nr:cell division protein SepF [Propionibacteriaceae bacterium]
MADRLRRVAEWAGLVTPSRYEDDFSDDEPTGQFEPTGPIESSAPARSANVTSLDQRRSRNLTVAREAGLDEIYQAHPRSYNADALRIGETFRDGTPVILNLIEMDQAEAVRLLDFVGGLKFAFNGTLERITSGVFMLLPPNVKLTDQDKERIAGGFFAHG